MVKLKRIICIITAAICAALPFSLAACGGDRKNKFDLSMPTFSQEDGWVQTMDDDFSRFSTIREVYDNTAWKPSPHGLRKTEYWCDKMITLDAGEGAVVIKSIKTENHDCDVCNAKNGIFTGGIETSDYDGNRRKETFAQAYGYFEAEVRVPRASGMWSAFWLQSYSVGKVGNKGRDGTEIDIYESSFMAKNPTKTGSALHWDAYDAPYYRMTDNVTDTGKNLYDGEYHKYSLLWAPDRYVFYVDGTPVWASDDGGVSKVAQYLKLTVEIRENKIGPYGQKLGGFENSSDGSTDFSIRKVSVWQNENFKSHIMSDGSYQDMKKTYDKAIAAACAIGAIIAAGIVWLIVLSVKRLRKKKVASSEISKVSND